MLMVHSDKKREPRYYVTEDLGFIGKVTVFESDYGDEALQWAIDHTTKYVEVKNQIELTSHSHIRGKKKN